MSAAIAKMNAISRTRTFCCCIPVRAGVILLALLGFLGGGAVSVIAIIGLKKSTGVETSMILQVVIYILLTLISLLGLVGGIGRKLALIRIYFAMLVMHLLFNMAGGIYAIWRVFKDAPNYVKECSLSKEDDPAVMKTCLEGASLLKGMMVAVFIAAWLIEIWACVIVFQYNRQLEEEEQTRSMVKDTEAW